MALNPYRQTLDDPRYGGNPYGAGGTGSFRPPSPTGAVAGTPTLPAGGAGQTQPGGTMNRYAGLVGRTPPTMPDLGPGLPGGIPPVRMPYNPFGSQTPSGMVGDPNYKPPQVAPGAGIMGQNLGPGVPQAPGPTLLRAGLPAMGSTYEPAAATGTLERPNATPTPEPGSTYSDVAMARPNANPVPVSEPTYTPPDPYKVSNRVDGVDTKVAGYDEGPMTEAGKLYADRIKGDLTTADNPYVRSIRETAERRATGNTYGAQSAAEEALGIAGITAGTSQYNRALAKAGAGANAANRDLLNDAAGQSREFYQKGMDRAASWEDTMYGRAKGQRDTTLDIAKYGDDRSDKQRSVDETGRLEKKGDALAYINSISDPKARAAARNLYEQGKDPRDAGIYDGYGGINEPYRSATPGKQDVEGLFDRIRSAYTGQVNPKTGAAWTEPEMRAEASRLYGQGLENEFRPLQQGATAADVEQIKQKQALGQPLTPAEQDALVKSGDTPSFSTPAQLPQDNTSQKQLVGKTIRVGQTNYKVVNAGSVVTSRTWYNAARNTDYMVLQDGAGQVVYAYGGQIHPTPPQEGPGARFGVMETR